MNLKYRFPMYERLRPHLPWRGGRITETDLLTLSEAAREASKHAGIEVTPADFLRAAARGEITLRAIVHVRARVQKHDGGIYCNQGQPDENTVPKGAILTLPLAACRQLANAGRASWRTFEGFEQIEDVLCRFDVAWLADDEPDFETLADDCRVIGFDVHSLADAYVETKETADLPSVEPVEQSQKQNDVELAGLTPMTRRAIISTLARQYPSLESDFNRSENWVQACKTEKRGEYFLEKVRAGCVKKWGINEPTSLATVFTHKMK